MCRDRAADSDSESSSVLFDSDVDFELVLGMPEQASAKVLTPTQLTSVQLGCASSLTVLLVGGGARCCFQW